jgi:DNA-binding response OmpR family regulator
MARILLIDDDESLRSMLRLLLTQHGHEVSEARHGKEGIALYVRENPDLVITDVVMPEKDGFETIMELRRRHGAKKIIAMSGGGHLSASEYLSTARQMGASRIVAKPFSNETIIAAVTEVLASA